MGLPPAIDLAGGSWIFLGVLVLIFAAIVIGYFTRTGSAIEPRPLGREADRAGGAAGAEGRGEVSGKDQGEGSPLDQHGVR